MPLGAGKCIEGGGSSIGYCALSCLDGRWLVRMRSNGSAGEKPVLSLFQDPINYALTNTYGF